MAGTFVYETLLLLLLFCLFILRWDATTFQQNLPLVQFNMSLF